MFGHIITLAAVLGIYVLLKGKIMTAKDDVFALASSIGDQIAKAQAEIIAKLNEMQEAGDNGADWVELRNRLTAVKTATQALDDIVKDPDPAPEDPPQG